MLSNTTFDNDIADIIVTQTSDPITTEDGGTATFDVVLTSQPLSDVVIPISSSDSSEGSLSFVSQEGEYTSFTLTLPKESL